MKSSNVYLRQSSEMVRGSIGRRSTSNFQRLLTKSNVQSLSYDAERQQAVFCPSDCVTVRRTCPVDGIYAADQGPEDIYNSCVAPMVDAMVDKGESCVIYAWGPHATEKINLLHGDTSLTEQDECPERPQWGLAYHAVEQLLKLGEKENFFVTAKCVKLHLDHIADALMPVEDQYDKQSHRKSLVRMLQLAQGPSLELDELPPTGSGQYIIHDLSHRTVKSIKDFSQVVEGYRSLHAAHNPLTNFGSRNKSTPFHFIITLTLHKRDVHRYESEEAEPRLHLVELGDCDWAAIPEETEEFQQSLQSVQNVFRYGHRLETRRKEEGSDGPLLMNDSLVNVTLHDPLKESMRSSTLTRIVHSLVPLGKMNAIMFACAKPSSTLNAMHYLAGCRGKLVGVIVEDSGDQRVDPELHQHMIQLQQECDELQETIETMEDDKKELGVRLKAGDEEIHKLTYQLSIVRKLSVTAGDAESTRGQALPTMGESLKRQASTASVFSRRKSMRMNTGRSQATPQIQRLTTAFDKEMEAIKEEDQRFSESCKQQLQLLRFNSAQAEGRVHALEDEVEALRKLAKEEKAKFDQEKASVEAEFNAKINELVEANRTMMDATNTSMRQTATSAEAQIRSLHERQEKVHKMQVAEEHTATKALSEAVTDLQEGWADEQAAMEKEIAEVLQERKEVQEELDRAERAYKGEEASLQRQITLLEKYLREVTKVVSRFEGLNSSETKRLVHIPKTGMTVYDPTTTHSMEWLEKRCRHLRKWLDQRGVPRPPVVIDLHTNAPCLVDPSLTKAAVPPTPPVKSAAVGTKKMKEEDSSATRSHQRANVCEVLHEELLESNRNLRISIEAQKRLLNNKSASLL